MPLPLVSGRLLFYAEVFARRAKLCEAARRVVAPYGRHGPRGTGGPVSRPYGAISVMRDMAAAAAMEPILFRCDL